MFMSEVTVNMPLAGLGSMIAIMVSWSVNHSILWAILHGICSWIYVVYYCLEYGR